MGMLNIAICDDDIAATTMLEELIIEIGATNGIKTNCSVFFDGSTLIHNFTQGTFYDLIFLDVEMGEINGIRVAEWIRKNAFPTLIVYVSGYEKYIEELCCTEPFRFLSKPVKKDKFCSVFLAAYERLTEKTPYFTFSYNKVYKKLPVKSIRYFESDNRLIYIHTLENTEKFYGKINDIEKQFSSNTIYRFLRIHQSFLVNFDFIKSMSFTRVELTDGQVLAISKDRQKLVRKQICAISSLEVMNDVDL